MTESQFLKDKTVSLVLGSGGARGLAHIGAIRVLEEAGVQIKSIAGSSMGALVGGIYAAGKLKAYEDWVCAMEQSEILSLLDWTFAAGGLIKGKKIIGKLEELVGDTNIEDLAIDYTAVAVDIDQGREVWLDQGSLFDAVRASIAIPGVFTPHRYRNRTLVDGGLLNPIPVAPTLRCMTDLTIVVDVNAAPSAELQAKRKKEKEKEEKDKKDKKDKKSEEGGVWDKLKDFVDGFSSDKEPSDSEPGLLAVMLRSLDTMEGVITRQQLAIFQPDLVVRIPKNACMVHEFHRAQEMIDLGTKLAREAVENNGKESAHA